MIILDYFSHIALACFIGYGLDYFLLDFTVLEMIFYYVFIILGSVLPDIDTPKSLIGCRIRPISDMLFNLVGHRTVTHSILVITVLFFVSIFIWGINIIAVGLMLGTMLHILGDLLTPGGVCLAYPISKKRYRLVK